MNSDRIKEIQEATAYPESTSVMTALKQVWNECEQEQVKNLTIPDVVHQREQFKSMVFDMANKLAIAGHGDEAMSMHRIHNRL